MAGDPRGQGLICLQQFYKCLWINVSTLKFNAQRHSSYNLCGRLPPCRWGVIAAGVRRQKQSKFTPNSGKMAPKIIIKHSLRLDLTRSFIFLHSLLQLYKKRPARPWMASLKRTCWIKCWMQSYMSYPAYKELKVCSRLEENEWSLWSQGLFKHYLPYSLAFHPWTMNDRKAETI